MDPFDEIEKRLQKYPNTKFESRDGHLTVFPVDDDGFPVTLEFDAKIREYVVTFGEFSHLHFSDSSEALEWFAFGLSDACRIETIYRDRTPVRSNIQSREGDYWRTVNETAILIPLFWKKRSRKMQQNNLIEASKPSAR